jgi:predicted secreted protein
MLLDPPVSYLRDAVSFDHACEIAKAFGEIEYILAWCKAGLDDEWRWQLVEISSERTPGRYIFYFDSERDYLAFSMRWR